MRRAVLPTRLPARIGIFAALAATAGLAVEGIYFRPAEQRLEARHREMASAEARPGRKADAGGERAERRRELDELRGRLERLLQNMPDRQDAGGLLTRLQSLATLSRVRMLGFTAHSPDRAEPSDSWSASLKLEGTYHALASLLALTARDPGTHSATEFMMKARDTTEGGATVVADVVVLTTVRLPEDVAPSRRAGDDAGSGGETLTYGAGDRRDPFLRPVIEVRDADPAPVFRPRGPGGIETAGAVLQGTLETPDGIVALVRGPDGRTHVVRTGDELFGGIVDSITADRMLILPPSNADPAGPARGEPLMMLSVAEAAQP